MSKKRITIEEMAATGACPCSICASQDVVDNFEQVGKEKFARLAVSAFEAKIQADNCIDK